MNRIGLAVLALGFSFAAAPSLLVADDVLVADVHAATQTPDALETLPRVGRDNISPLVVFTRHEVVADQSRPGDIFYQRFNNSGVPMGSAIRITPDVDYSSDDRQADVSGSRVVYAAWVPGTSSGIIRTYDIADGSTTDLSALATVSVPRIHGNVVVWLERTDPGGMKVQLLDLTWPILTPLALRSGVDASWIDVGGRQVVWDEWDGTSHNVLSYDLWTGETRSVADTSADETRPATFSSLGEDFVVWQESSPEQSRILVRRITTLGFDAPGPVIEVAAAENPAYLRNPTISDDLISYESSVSGNSDLLLYRMSDGSTHRVTSTPTSEVLPNLFGDSVTGVVAYAGITTGGILDIFLARLTFVTDPCAVLGGDEDSDGVCGQQDNCPVLANADQSDRDHDGIGDACDPSTAFEGLELAVQMSLRPGANDDWFALEGLFKLGSASDGIDPLSEPLDISLGTGHWTVPAGAFRRGLFGSSVFTGLVGPARLTMAIQPLGSARYVFFVVGSGAELDGTTNPVPLVLSIGDDYGAGSVRALIR